MMTRKTFHLCVVIIFIITHSGCYPNEELTVENTDLVITNYNPGYYFTSINTYFLADSIQYISDDTIEPDRSWDDFIISELERNFNTIGYIRQPTYDNSNPPNVVVVVSVNNSSTASIFTHPWYGGWGDGWNFTGYQWGYPWWTGTTVITEHALGTLAWQMFDPSKVDFDTKTIFIEWTGAINGLIGSSSSVTHSRISGGIDQAFKQSSYLIPNY